MTGTGFSQVRATGMLTMLRQGDPGVLVVAVVLLAAGWGLRMYYADRTVQFRGLGLTLEYPESWGSARVLPVKEGEPRMMRLANVLSEGSVKPAIKVSSEVVPREVKPSDVPSYLLLDRQRQCNLFHLISRKQKDLGRAGKSYRLEFAHAINPADDADDPAATDTPVVLRVSSLVLHRGRKLLRVDVSQTLAQHRADPGLAGRVLATVKER